MRFLVTVRTEQDTLLCLLENGIPAPVRKRSQVQSKCLHGWRGMMELQRCEICLVSALGALGALQGDQPDLAAPSPTLLRRIRLQAVVGIVVLAFSGTKF